MELHGLTSFVGSTVLIYLTVNAVSYTVYGVLSALYNATSFVLCLLWRSERCANSVDLKHDEQPVQHSKLHVAIYYFFIEVLVKICADVWFVLAPVRYALFALWTLVATIVGIIVRFVMFVGWIVAIPFRPLFQVLLWPISLLQIVWNALLACISAPFALGYWVFAEYPLLTCIILVPLVFFYLIGAYVTPKMEMLEHTSEPTTSNGDATNTSCIICLENARNVVFFPCKHMCVCRGCAKITRRYNHACPVCRAHIEKAVEIYT
uniref:RING-type domain-containing protein n=1 Tax=Anopheles dirus TaxID=7168 RepID=A0A182NTU8_9DIPT